MGERQRWGAFALNTQGHPSVAPPPIARYPSTSSQPVESGRPGANIQLVLSPGTRGDQTGATLGSGALGRDCLPVPRARPPPRCSAALSGWCSQDPVTTSTSGLGLPSALCRIKGGEGPSEAGPGPLGRGWGWPTCCA